MSDLIVRLESATEGSRTLDVLICQAIGNLVRMDLPTPGPFYHAAEFDIRSVPFYTTSIDAALTLVPEGWGWQVRVNNDGGKVASVILLASVDAKVGDFYKVAATPALALCAAALRARGL